VDNAKLSALEVLTFDGDPGPDPGPTGASGSLAVTPNSSNINVSSYGNGSFIVTNTSSSGEKITTVRLDMSTAIFPKIVFDPDGLAGDVVGKPFTLNSEGGTGFVGSTLTDFHNGVDASDGYDALELEFDDFGPGKTMTFSIDVDPVSIKGTGSPGPNEAGAVSGLEKVGSTVTMTFDDDTTLVGDVVSDGSNGGGVAELVPDPLDAPVLEVVGVTPPATVTDPNVTVSLTGEPGAPVELLRVLGGMFLPTTGPYAGVGYDVEPFDANSAVQVELLTGTSIGPDGTVDIDVTLTRQPSPLAELNHLVAIVRDADGAPSRISNLAVLEYDPESGPDPDPEPEALYRVNAGGPALSADPAWSEDSTSNPSPYVNAGDAGISTFSNSVAIDMSDPSVPSYVPEALFQTERKSLEQQGGGDLVWTFPVEPGEYDVTLYFAEIFESISETEPADLRRVDQR
jgi:large repetitive protein